MFSSLLSRSFVLCVSAVSSFVVSFSVRASAQSVGVQSLGIESGRLSVQVGSSASNRISNSLSRVSLLQTAQGQQVDIKIDPAGLRATLEEFSGVRPVVIGQQTVRITERRSAQGRDLARAYLAQSLSQMGYKVGFQKYDVGANVIAEKPGQRPGFVVVSFHLDSAGNAGANDDGSGAIATLAIAQILAKVPATYGVRIIGFDNEENGLWGSRFYMRSFGSQRPDIVAAYHLEQMGFNGRNDGAFHVMDCQRPDSVPLTQKIIQHIGSRGLKLSPACTDRSDHYWYWQSNVPAVVISENFFGGDFDPCYHKSCDVVDDRLNFSYMARITEVVAMAAVQSVLGR